jgi:outer membrane protein assembly factor BamB
MYNFLRYIAIICMGYLLISCSSTDSERIINKAFFSEFGENWPFFRGNQMLTGKVDNTEKSFPEHLFVRWRKKSDGAVKAVPVIQDGRLFVGTYKKQMLCLNVTNGEMLWSFTADESIEGAALIVSNKVIFGTYSGKVYALDVRSGNKIWEYLTEDKIITSPNVVLRDEMTYIIISGYDGYIYCLNAENGKLNWKFETDSYIGGSPAVHNDMIIAAGCDGIFRMIDMDGKQSMSVILGTYIGASVSLDSNAGYVGTYDGDFFAVDYIRHKIKWKFSAADGSPYLGASGIESNVVYCASQNGTVYALSKKSGSVVWDYSVGEKIATSPLIAGNAVVFGAADGRLYAVNKNTGKEIYTFVSGASISSSPVITRHGLILCNDDGYIYCLGGSY